MSREEHDAAYGVALEVECAYSLLGVKRIELLQLLETRRMCDILITVIWVTYACK